MKIFIHSIFIVSIAALSYAVYGAWFKDWGKKHYEGVKRSFLSPIVFFFSPKTLSGYVKHYKAAALSSLLFFIAVYILLICGLISGKLVIVG